MADLVKHSELTVQQITDIKKSILVSLRSKEAFWDKFCSHEPAITDGFSKYEWRKLNVASGLDPATIQELTEGHTPDALELTYSSFEVSPKDFGDWIGYTDKSKKYNYDDVVRDAKTILGQRAFDIIEAKKGQQFISGLCTMDLTADNVTDHFLKDLLHARILLKKNHVKPLSGNKYGCIVTPEQSAQILLDYKDQIKHTAQKEALIEGYSGELGGFILFENADPVMYKAAVAASGTQGQEGYVAAQNAKGYCLFVGKTEYGLPVRTVSFGNSSVQVFDNGLGSVPEYESANGVTKVKPDALHQRGSVAFKVMGFATTILFDEAIIRAEFDLGSDGALELSITETSRTGYKAKSTSPAN